MKRLSGCHTAARTMAKILVIEDDPDILKAVSDHLAFEHNVVETVSTGNDGLSRLRAYTYDIAIVDWNLPDKSGIDICREYRSSGGNALMLMLTGKSLLNDKEQGLDAGFDDYLVKPFEMRELTARLRALLRRSSARIDCNNLKAGEIELEPNSFRVTRSGEDVKLVPKEFAILEFLMRHPQVVFSCEALMSRIWTADEDTSPEIIRTHIKNLRKKIESPDQPALIQTVHGAGYKLVVPKEQSASCKPASV
jgi:DNA-binding response OmpR family regulator